MLSKFTPFTDVCMAGWQLLPLSHTNVCKFALIQKGISPSIFNILLSYLLFSLNVPVSFNFRVFSFARITRQFSIILDNEAIKDRRQIQRSAFPIMVPEQSKRMNKKHAIHNRVNALSVNRFATNGDCYWSTNHFTSSYPANFSHQVGSSAPVSVRAMKANAR